MPHTSRGQKQCSELSFYRAFRDYQGVALSLDLFKAFVRLTKEVFNLKQTGWRGPVMALQAPGIPQGTAISAIIR